MNHLKKNAPFLVAGLLLVISVGIVVGTNYESFFGQAQTSNGATKLDADIARGEAVVKKKPELAQPYLALSSLYLQKARETVDSTYYTKISALMDQAEKIDPQNPDIQATRASVAMGRHDFRNAKMFITKAIELQPYTAAYYGLLGDADIELGLYEEAVMSFQKMVDIRPSFNSWSRIAYIRELYGDIKGAESAFKEAINAGSSYPENIAWAHVELGKLQMRTDLEEAEKSFSDALLLLPTCTQAMEGLGKIAFAKKNIAEAEKQFTKAYTLLPLAQYAIDLGDLYSATGNKEKAAQQYALAQVAFGKSRKGGINTDLEESLFLSDHELDVAQALAMAERAYAERPSIYGADYLSWALYKNGKITEAAALTNEALRLGLTDPVILHHQARIAKATGDRTQAKIYIQKVYELSPHFSILYADDLEKQRDSLK